VYELDPEQAFRESLFDALGDDEGANFWEGVYGQPIHKYPNRYIDDETGELETMDDDEYARYVRRKMWEKSREGIEAAREEKRREKARQRQQEEEDMRQQPSNAQNGSNEYAHNNFAFDFEIAASLKRGRKRKEQKRWRELWTGYLQRWSVLQDFARSHNRETTEQNLFLRNRIAWPVASGKRNDLEADTIREFIEKGSEAASSDDELPDAAFLSALKIERIRWHPDKIQQRYGFMAIDESTLKAVTATFQIIDAMWNESRAHKK
jgi:hypothetical protein